MAEGKESEALKEVHRRREERAGREDISLSDWELVEEAVAKKQWDAVRWVLRQGAIDDINKLRGVEKTTLLHDACHDGDLETVKMLCQEMGADAGFPSGELRWAAVHWAAKGGHPDVLRFLLTEGGADVNGKTVSGARPLHVGAHSLPVVQCLVEEFGADVHAAGQFGEPPLPCAVRAGDVSCMRYLLGRGAHVDPKTFSIRRVLGYVAAADSADALRFLVEECGCDPSDGNDEENVIFAAIANDSVEALDYLGEECGLSLDVGEGSERSLLGFAAEVGAMAVAEWLVQRHGFSPDEEDGLGSRPLHNAALHGNLSMVKWLVKQCGVDVEAPDSEGRRPVHLAIEEQHLPVVRFFLEEGGADVNAQTEEWYGSDAPLHVAAESGDLSCVRYLVEEADADVLLQNRYGRRPSQVTPPAPAGHDDVAAYLRDAEEMAQMQKNPE